MNGKTVPPRNEIPKVDTWNHESVFKDFQAWEDEVKAIQDELKTFQRFHSTFTQSPEQLAEALETRDLLTGRLMTVLMYAMIS
ncbi:MAG TPA: hypothetical protein VLM80_04125, partial [Anaerolineales bacterium]|nr:hypothetical protein [Anaerolineales bacterium]